MHYDQLLEGAFRERLLETKFSEVLRAMSPEVREELPGIIEQRTKLVAERLNYPIRDDIDAETYVSRRLAEADGYGSNLANFEDELYEFEDELDDLDDELEEVLSELNDGD